VSFIVPVATLGLVHPLPGGPVRALRGGRGGQLAKVTEMRQGRAARVAARALSARLLRSRPAAGTRRRAGAVTAAELPAAAPGRFRNRR
jgi:hypothetical protein